ncbi:MAG TPA: hypothetical protein VJT72_13225 [Pseudonocardiaceae bacterium]|nr:hypothetical protein [Pseudonocardiaceae bacterium]
MKIAIIGKHRAERLVSAVAGRRQAEIVLCGPIDVSSFVGLGTRYRRLALDADEAAVLSALEDEQIDVVIPSLNPLNQEQTLPMLTAACLRWSGPGRHAVVHSPAFADLATDKVYFHRTAVSRGWPVPNGMQCASIRELIIAAGELELPLMVKQARSMPREGRWYIESVDQLAELTTTKFPLLAQRACCGEEFGLELLTSDGHTTCWPVASFGPLDPEGMPTWRCRVMPVKLPTSAWIELQRFIEEVTAAFTPHGPWQIDFAVCAGQLQILEVNGRLGGMTDLSWAVTGVDPYEAFAAVALRQPSVEPAPQRIAMELPVRNDVDLENLPEASQGVHVQPQLPLPTNCWTNESLRILVAAADGIALRAWLRSFGRDLLVRDLSEALSVAEKGFLETL